MKLVKVKINKYKSFSLSQEVELDEKISVLVGKNESGKTAFLEALAKTNYFEQDKKFMFNTTNDYPRTNLAKYKKSGNTDDVITCTYKLEEEEKEILLDRLGDGVYEKNTFTLTTNFDNEEIWEVGKVNEEKYLVNLIESLEIDKPTGEDIIACKNINTAISFCDGYEGDIDLSEVKNDLNNVLTNGFKWENKLEGYIAKTILKPMLPKFWYFDEYYELLGEINLKDLKENRLSGEHSKTAKALFDLAGIDLSALVSSNNFEDFKAQLESTSNEITDQIFDYWKTNSDLDIQFDIQKERVINDPNQPFEKIILHVRIYNRKYRLSLPLSNRSKGFNWFFSFIVWFSKIQSDEDKNFVLLLDEPGLNLHASAQDDLLRFISDLSKDYQIIYSTHSPFMIEPEHLERVRTVYDGEKGSVVSDAVQEKDPKTLFPLQAALGYDIAQNLFISPHNLLIEGVSDLVYLTSMSSVLESAGRVGLDAKITLVPVGGLDKVPMFISLLRGSKLDIACLLDSFSLPESQRQKLKDLIIERIAKEKNIKFFDEFSGNNGDKADIEDVFDKEDYLKLFNAAFEGKYNEVKLENVSNDNETIVNQINRYLGVNRYNHYKPANKLASLGVDESFFKAETLDRFEKIFKELNKLF